jgi:hypothetical protein
MEKGRTIESIGVTHDEVVEHTVERARRHGIMWEASQLCWCGSPLAKHVEMGWQGFLACQHGEEMPPPRPVNEWEPYSIPSSWCAF